MRKLLASIGTALLVSVAAPLASAASLQVAPVSIEVAAPAATSSITLKNPSGAPLKAQVRVYKWSLVNGQEHLEPATDVVASPPMASLQPNTDYTVRIARLSKQPVAIEETYRLLVDEIPDPSSRIPGQVNFAIRYSLPVFFTPGTTAQPALAWSFARRDGKLYVSATNTGNRRARIADLKVAGPDGNAAMVAKGLAGYVLARSSKSWVMPPSLQKSGLHGPLQVTAEADVGPINANALPEAPR